MSDNNESPDAVEGDQTEQAHGGAPDESAISELPAPDASITPPIDAPPSTGLGQPEVTSAAEAPRSTNFVNKLLDGKKKFVALGVVAALIVGAGAVLLGGSGKTSGNATVEYFALDKDGAIYLASLKDDQLVVSTRLAEEPTSITYYESLSSPDPQELTVVLIGDQVYVWDDEDGDGSEDVLAFNKKTGASTVVYSGNDIDNVMFIADQNTFIVNDDSNCFAIPIGKVSTRISPNDCEIIGGRVFSREYESDGVTLEEVEVTGASLGRYRLSIESSILLHDNGGLISGLTEDGVFEVYSTSDGTRMFRAESTETYNILDTAKNSTNFLVAREDSEADDETLDVGVISIADGSGSFNVLTATYSSSGWISADGSSALIFTAESEESTTVDLDLWKVADKTSTTVLRGIDEVIMTADDSAGRLGVITDRELVVGTFETGFATRATGSFDDGYMYSGSSGLLVQVGEDNEYDLLFVEDGVANDGGNRTITLATGLESASLRFTSLAVEGVVYYSTSSNNYTDIFRQELIDGSSPVKVAEGRIEDYFVAPDGVLSYYEYESDRIVGSFIQRTEKPESRVKVSDRNVYLPLSVKIDPTRLEFVRSYLDTYTAFVDQDLKLCRSRNYPVLRNGTSEDFTLTRENNSSYVTYALSDYKFFCVSNASEIAFTSASRFDGESTRWVGIECSDTEGNDDSERGNLNNGEVSISMPGNGVQVCAIYDWSDYYSEYSYELDEYIDPVRGMNVTIEIR